ncbi:DDRGK domain-containing protein 1 [Venturia canescens]|uniref:DDRGK domain-containing protein 1 n=1 Tax=Venturia canescens TaxID=32260 RepID=UPI001C9BEEB6|nr:DDRGK domain-containing protein 1 [Venturia canescens]
MSTLKMDVNVLIALSAGLAIMIAIITIFTRRASAQKENVEEIVAPRGQPVRRAAGVRNARRRMRGGVAGPVEAVEDDGSDNGDVADMEEKAELADSKLGAKKRAKLEAKAEKKIHREAAEREREERKKKEKLLQEESDKLREKEKAEELQKEEAEKKAREEIERQKHEEYLEMKKAFSVEEEGFDENAEGDEEDLLQKFLQYIKQNKVVILEDLAAHFGIKTASVIERIQGLQASGSLTGVIDDRGKFIYISQSELEDVAKFVRQRGRVSITELAENSNRLINLNPGTNTEIVEAN